MDEKDADAFLSHGLENVRYAVTKGKYRVVLVDMWDHTATIMGDYDSLEEAKEHIEDNFEGDEYTSMVIYDDQGKLLYDTDRDTEEEKPGIKFNVGGEEVEIQFPNGEDENYAVVIFFLDENGKFEDLLFDTFENLEDAKKYAEKAREEHEEAWKIVIVDREGKEVQN